MLKELSVFVFLEKPDAKVDILIVGCVVTLPIRFCGDQVFQNFYKEFMKVLEEFFVCVFWEKPDAKINFLKTAV